MCSVIQGAVHLDLGTNLLASRAWLSPACTVPTVTDSSTLPEAFTVDFVGNTINALQVQGCQCVPCIVTKWKSSKKMPVFVFREHSRQDDLCLNTLKGSIKQHD